MPIQESDVRRIARLAHLKLDESEVARFRDQLQSILDHVRALEELDLDDVSPTVHCTLPGQRLREDEVRPGLSPEEALRNAPDPAAGHFRVPRVLEE